MFRARAFGSLRALRCLVTSPGPASAGPCNAPGTCRCLRVREAGASLATSQILPPQRPWPLQRPWYLFNVTNPAPERSWYFLIPHSGSYFSVCLDDLVPKKPFREAHGAQLESKRCPKSTEWRRNAHRKHPQSICETQPGTDLSPRSLLERSWVPF